MVQILDIRLIPQRGRNYVNATFSFARTLAKVNVKFSLDFEKPDKTRFQVLNLKIDICKLLNGEASKHKVVKLLLQQLREQKHFLQTCPLEAVNIDL